MSKKIQLTIAEPCHENWDGMTPVEKGRFCGSCQKQVIDFSNMSDRQVADFFKKPSTGSVCGRFMTDQLDRAIEIPKKRMPWVKYFFQIAIPAFLVSIKVSAQKTQGQIQVKAAAKDTTKRGGVFADERITLGMVARPQNIKPFMGDTVVVLVKDPVQILKGEIAIKDTLKEPVCTQPLMGAVAYFEPKIEKINKDEIRGRVVNEQGEPIPFASIETGKKGEGLVADENGYFIIQKKWLKKGNGITISSVGYEAEKIIAGEEKYMTGELYVQLKSNVVLDEVVLNASGTAIRCTAMMGAVSYVKGQTISVIDTKNTGVDKEMKIPAEGNRLLVYPNPVVQGASINLSFKKLDEGYYQLQLLSQSGQLVKQQEIWIDTEARLMNIDVPVVAAGSYFIVLTNKKTGKKLTEKIIVQ